LHPFPASRIFIQLKGFIYGKRICPFIRLWLSSYPLGVIMRNVSKWTFITMIAVIVASFPTWLSSHDIALGLPLTWYSWREAIFFDPPSHDFSGHDFSVLTLLLNFFLVSLAIELLITFFRRKAKNDRRHIDDA